VPKFNNLGVLNKKHIYSTVVSVALIFICFMAWKGLKGLPSVNEWVMVFRMEVIVGCLALVGCFLLAFYLRGLRWMMLVKGTLSDDKKQWVSVYGAAFALGSFTPGRAGELLRVAWMKSNSYPFAYGAGAIFIERLQDLLFVFLILIFGVVLSPGVDSWVTRPVVVSFCVALLVYIALVSNTKEMSIYLPSKIIFFRKKEWLMTQFDNLLSGMSLLSDFSRHVSVFVFGLGIWILHVLGFSLFLYAWDPGLPLFLGGLVLALVNLSGLLHLTPGNIGPYEIVGTLVLEQWGVSVNEGMVVMIVLHATSLLIVSVYGAMCMLSYRRESDIDKQQNHLG